MTQIHAGIPRDLVDGVKEAQSRGDDKEVMETEAKVNGKGKAKITPAPTKVQRIPEDEEENLRRRGITAEPESDPESDWIPGPIKSPKALPARRNNIFGIKGLDEGLHFDSSPKRVFSPAGKSNTPEATENTDDSDPFITITTKRPAPHSFSLRVPSSNIADLTKQASSDTPELLKFSHQNPFSAIQPNNQTRPLLKEFSWSWDEAEIMHDEGKGRDPSVKAGVRKRMAGAEFKERQAWEMKRLKRSGFDLKRYNRGEFGPRTGIARL